MKTSLLDLHDKLSPELSRHRAASEHPPGVEIAFEPFGPFGLISLPLMLDAGRTAQMVYRPHGLLAAHNEKTSS
jgi:hypothetical protein